ncbi:hypothetical protein L218DRAFT_1002968 [Marasmius fiardii PR-910]|nr:hypothetical protein L218DRAFT_1002968 [Marasmius fiardii PR-910]
MPRLWSNITLHYWPNRSDEEDSAELLYRTVEFVLVRVGSGPLTLRFSILYPKIPKATNFSRGFIRTLEALCRRASQWESVEFSTPPSFLHHPAFKLAKGNLHSLRGLYIEDDINRDHGASGEFYDLNCLGDCSALRDLSLNLLLFRLGHSFNSNLRWWQLQTLSRNRINAGQSRTGVHTFINLASLSISAESGVHLLSFLRQVTLPRLSSLECIVRNSLTDLTLVFDESLLEFLTRSSCRITFLTLSRYSILGLGLINLFHLLPSLITLHVGEQEAWDDLDVDCRGPPLEFTTTICTRRLFKSLVLKPYLTHAITGDSPQAAPDSATRLLPRVRDLYINVHKRDFDIDALYEVMLSRWIPDPLVVARGGITCPWKVRVKFIDIDPCDPPKKLQRWIELGRLKMTSSRYDRMLEVEFVL